MAAHARLKNEFKEDEKYHNLMSWLKLSISTGKIVDVCEPRREKTCLRKFATRLDSNRLAQLQELARGVAKPYKTQYNLLSFILLPH